MAQPVVAQAVPVQAQPVVAQAVPAQPVYAQAQPVAAQQVYVQPKPTVAVIQQPQVVYAQQRQPVVVVQQRQPGVTYIPERYCGPVSWIIAFILIWFIGPFAIFVIACPCDERPVPIRNNCQTTTTYQVA